MILTHSIIFQVIAMEVGRFLDKATLFCLMLTSRQMSEQVIKKFGNISGFDFLNACVSFGGEELPTVRPALCPSTLSATITLT